MKRILVGLIMAASMGLAALPTTSAYVANAVGTPGKPIMAISNTGSTAGQAHRSSTGTNMKTTNDRIEWIWD